MQSVDFYFSPLHPPLSLPLSVVTLLAMGFGTLFGGFFIWCLHGPLSPKADKKRAQVYDLLKENKKIKDEQVMQQQISMPLLEQK
jgi:hypothetical protein